MFYTFEEPLLQAHQVAEYLGLSTQTLYNMRLRGEGPVAYKFGGRSGSLRYERTEVEQWLDECREVGK